jgi:hypothetical protein
MTDIADKIYAATGLTLGAEAAAAIERLIQAENEKLRAENAKLAASNHAYLSDYQEAADEIEKLRAALDAAARALHKAGEKFAFYANQHAAKGTADGDQKAATNQQWAQRCFDAHDAALGEKQ